MLPKGVVWIITTALLGTVVLLARAVVVVVMDGWASGVGQ